MAYVFDCTTGKQLRAADQATATAYVIYMNSLAGFEKFRVITE